MTSLFLCASDMNLGDAALYAIVGFIIVLAVLALLVGIFYLSGALFKTKALSKENLFERKKPAPQADEVIEEDDDELVAAITAAVSVVLAGENSEPDAVPEFVIRRITRK